MRFQWTLSTLIGMNEDVVNHAKGAHGVFQVVASYTHTYVYTRTITSAFERRVRGNLYEFT